MALPAALVLALAWTAGACGTREADVVGGEGEGTGAPAGAPGGAAAVTGPEGAAAPGAAPDSSTFPVTVTLVRDSLGVAADAPTEAVQAAMARALERLGEAADFEVLAVSPAVVAAQLRARPPGDAQALARALAGHPLVAAAEVERLLGPGG